MTPPAATAAGRTLPRPVAPRAPRRVSGPAARPRRGVADAPPRTRTRKPAAQADPFVLRALHRTRALSDSRFLDRLIRGRLWIPLVAAGLMGIVFMQVSMLKLNAGIGRAVQTAATLERQNTNLRAGVSRMESGTNVERVAHDLGMVVPADGSAAYVNAATSGLATAATRRMTAADPDAILRSKQATALAAGQTLGTATTGTAGATGATTPAAAVTQTAAVGTAATTGTAPTGTTATAPVTPAATTGATSTGATGTGTPAATTGTGTATGTPAATTPATSTPSTSGAATAPTTQQQTASAPTTASTSGGAVAPPQG